MKRIRYYLAYAVTNLGDRIMLIGSRIDVDGYEAIVLRGWGTDD